MSPESGPPTKSSVEGLATQVAGLRSAYENYRRLVKWLVALVVVLILMIIWLWIVAGDAEKAAQDAEKAARDASAAISATNNAAVVNCQNNNDSRANTRLLWNFMLGASAAQQTDPDRKAATEAVLGWINILYGERDCSNPAKKYEIPPPPDLSKLLGDSSDR